MNKLAAGYVGANTPPILLGKYRATSDPSEPAPAAKRRVPENGQEPTSSARTRGPVAETGAVYIDDDNQSRLSKQDAPEGQSDPRLNALSDMVCLVRRRISRLSSSRSSLRRRRSCPRRWTSCQRFWTL